MVYFFFNLFTIFMVFLLRLVHRWEYRLLIQLFQASFWHPNLLWDYQYQLKISQEHNLIFSLFPLLESMLFVWNYFEWNTLDWSSLNSLQKMCSKSSDFVSKFFRGNRCHFIEDLFIEMEIRSEFHVVFLNEDFGCFLDCLISNSSHEWIWKKFISLIYEK